LKLQEFDIDLEFGMELEHSERTLLAAIDAKVEADKFHKVSEL
jgi:hypothetical protein